MRASLIMMLGVLLGMPLVIRAQAAPAAGSITVRGRNVKGPEKGSLPLARKRFYLFPGGLAENKALIDRISATDFTSRDCFYSGIQASPCFIEWLKAENCASPFCRPVKREEISGIREFESAYSKGLAAYRNKPEIALSWIAANLPSNLATGYRNYQRTFLERALGPQKPLQANLSTNGGAEAAFAGVAVTGKSSKYLISNVLPVEIGNKSYVWACEVDVQPTKPTALILALPLDPKRKNCVLVEKELRVCTVEACAKK